MTGIHSGNMDPNGEEPERWPDRTCPLCGDDCRRLPNHFRHHCTATDGGTDR
jgi:hypothetical protein